MLLLDQKYVDRGTVTLLDENTVITLQGGVGNTCWMR